MWTHLFTQMPLFPKRGNEFADLACLTLLVWKAPAGVADTIFCYTSPAKRLCAQRPLLFPQRERDCESQILDLIFSVLHRAFGAMNPMVRRTAGFLATKSGFETNGILTISFCEALSAT